LGIFHEDDWQLKGDSRIAIWGNYILQHTRIQLSFGGWLCQCRRLQSVDGTPLSDMWWLALSMIVMCVVERTKLENIVNIMWFNIFSLSKRSPFFCGVGIDNHEAFETVSAYGTVGLSLGVPTVRLRALPTSQFLSPLPRQNTRSPVRSSLAPSLFSVP